MSTIVAGPLTPADVAHHLAQARSDWLIRGGFFFVIGAAMASVTRGLQAQAVVNEHLLFKNDSILNAAGEGICGLDRDGVITFANPTAAALTGYELTALIGRSFHDAIHGRADGSPYPSEECPAAAWLDDGMLHRTEGDAYWRPDGSSFPVEYTSTPVLEEDRVTGAVVVFKDVTERRAGELLLDRQRQQLIEAQSVGGFGSWEWDVVADKVEWSDQLCRIYGLEPGGRPGSLEVAIAPVHRDDQAQLRAHVRASLQSGEPLDFESRIVRPDGALRTIHILGEVSSDEHRSAVRMVGTVQDITERREVERAKDEFTSVVSHELRTPLTSIRGSLGLLESGVVGKLPKQGQRMVEIAVQNTDRLVRLINDILDIERIDSGEIDMRPVACNARELIDRANDATASLAGAANITVVTEGDPILLTADPDRVIQTLTNLIGNAVKFSPPASNVRVSCSRGDGVVLFEIRDEGRGIPAENLESIFGRFQQVDASDSRQKGGTGLGLAICRSVVEQHGGRIWAQSTPGRGATFSFVLPAPIAYDAAALEPVGADKLTVLVCDDDESVIDVASAVLEQRGYRVIAAHCGEQALQYAIDHRPDAILLDMLMPGMSGWETAAALGQHAETKDIPIVILSVLGVAETEAPEGAIVEWVQKPLDDGQLFAALERAVRGRTEPFKVLVVEDDRDLAGVLTATFERHGIETFHAATGAEAIEVSQRVLPDLLVLDLGLPEVNGFEVVGWLRRHERLHAVPMLIYTARDLSEDDRRRLRLGSTTEFLTKGRLTPLDFDQRVMALLGRLTATSRQEIEHEPEAHPVGR